MDEIIQKMSSDLGIHQLNEEAIAHYECRVIYSAMASWIKAIALDQPVGSLEDGVVGVSRRHINMRSQEVFDSLMGIFPETSYWFELDNTENHPVNLIRERLINHEDLLNAGFDTNLSLSYIHSIPLSSRFETVYGKVLDVGKLYSGISMIHEVDIDPPIMQVKAEFPTIKEFAKRVCWEPMSLDKLEPTYFDPANNAKNNYSAWKDTLPDCKSEIFLARIQINKIGYEYYLLKPEKRLMHKIDPFLQGQGYHTMIMYELRKEANNSVVVSFANYNDHIRIRLYTHLPIRERILLESYAWPYHRIDDKLCWIMYDYVWEYIKPYFERIGMQILEEKHG